VDNLPHQTKNNQMDQAKEITTPALAQVIETVLLNTTLIEAQSQQIVSLKVVPKRLSPLKME
jgi:hypothetical protein